MSVTRIFGNQSLRKTLKKSNIKGNASQIGVAETSVSTLLLKIHDGRRLTNGVNGNRILRKGYEKLP